MKLRVPDRVALTAFRTLTDVMGYAETLFSLEREDYFLVRVIAETPEAAVDYVKKGVEETAFFANPNKETAVVAPKSRPISTDEKMTVLTFPAAGLELPRLKSRLLALGYDKVEAAGRGVIWRLLLRKGTRPEEALKLVVTKSRAEGLLMNPHSERFEVI